MPKSQSSNAGTDVKDPDTPDGIVSMGTATCPKCGYVQPESGECSRCGLIISKFRQAIIAEGPVTSSIIFYDLAKERRQIWLLAFLLLALSFLAYRLWTTRDITYPPGVLIGSEPLQVMIKEPKPWKIGGRVFSPLAEFSLKARVLSSERYYFDSFADIGPIDLALGWGPMSDQSILDQLDIDQGNRRFAIASKNPVSPLPIYFLLSHSANMHMLPANREIKKQLCLVRTGDLIALKGYLVGVRENGQWTLFSSLSRTDVGDGACEIVWVEHFEIVKGKKLP